MVDRVRKRGGRAAKMKAHESPQKTEAAYIVRKVP